MSKILITGGAGFLGSHLVDKLLEQGNEVIVMDNFCTGQRKNIEHIKDKITFLETDVRSSFVVRDLLMKVGKVDEIYSAASPASPISYLKIPIKTWETNILGSMHMLEYAEICQAKIMLFSTSEIYGSPLQHPQQESYWGNVSCTGPRSVYDESKRASESLFFAYHREHGTRIKVARIFNTYGSRLAKDDGRVVSAFIIQALQDSPITVFGDGRQTRSYMFISDCVEGLTKLMNSPDDFIGPCNIGNPYTEYDVLHLAETIIELTNSKSQIVFKDLPSDDPHRRKPNIDLSWEKLSWKPKVDLKEGLIKTIEYFKQITNEQL